MRVLRLVTVLAAAAAAAGVGVILAQQAPKGIRLATLTWPEAAAVLRPDTVVVIPLGAGSKEHGPHLKLGNDAIIADYLTRRVLDASDVVVAPALPYHFYPAFVEYPGSTSLALETARALTADVALNLARFGPRRFYVLNTGISTVRALEPAARALAAQGILLGYTDLGARLDCAAAPVRQQEGGTHADEIETSMTLFIDPAAVDMRRAIKEYTPSPGPLRLTRTRGGAGTFSESGIGETRRSRRGERTGHRRGAGGPDPRGHRGDSARAAAVAERAGAPAAGACPPGSGRRLGRGAPAGLLTRGRTDDPRIGAKPSRCTGRNADAVKLSLLWSEGGDMVHPDGRIERGRRAIMTNRVWLFMQREYRGLRHPLTVGNVRCVNADVAVADGKWELRGVSDCRQASCCQPSRVCSHWSVQRTRRLADRGGPIHAEAGCRTDADVAETSGLPGRAG